MQCGPEFPRATVVAPGPLNPEHCYFSILPASLTAATFFLGPSKGPALSFDWTECPHRTEPETAAD